MNLTSTCTILLVIFGIGTNLADSQNKSKDPTAVHTEKFSVLRSEMDGKPLLAVIDTGLSGLKEKASTPWFVSISTPLIAPLESGLPNAEDSNNLNAWEDQLGAELKSQCNPIYVGHVSWNGHREVLFYVDNLETATNILRTLSKSQKPRRFAFRISQDAEWKSVSPYFSPRH